MADIEVIIKIPREDFAIMKHNIAINNPLCPLSQEEMVSKVANGVPLPIIIDKIRAEIDDINLNDVATEYEDRFYGFQQEVIKIIDNYKAESEE